VTAKPTQHAWSSEALFSKALLYVEEMERYTADDWQFGLWASLSLELIARASLSHISPTLLASRKDWRNVHHALGRSADLVGIYACFSGYQRSNVDFEGNRTGLH